MDLSLLDQHSPLSSVQRQHFKVVDQGQYNYLLNGEITDLQEPWQILKNGNLTIIRSVRFSKKYHVSLSVFAHISGKSQSIDLSYAETGERIEAQYKIDDQGRWSVVQSHQGNLYHNKGQVEGLTMFPLLRVFSGAMLSDCYLSGNEQKTVLVPDIRTACDYQDKLKPSFDLRKSKFVSHTSKGKKFKFVSQHYDEQSAEFYLNKKGLLSQYSWQQTEKTHWQVFLTE